MPIQTRQPISMPDITGYSRGQLLRQGEDYLAYSDEQWHMYWEEIEEADRQRGFALLFGFMATRFFPFSGARARRYQARAQSASEKSEVHRTIASDYREVAEEAESASHIVYEAAEERHANDPEGW
jgi:hypothetical protein